MSKRIKLLRLANFSLPKLIPRAHPESSRPRIQMPSVPPISSEARTTPRRQLSSPCTSSSSPSCTRYACQCWWAQKTSQHPLHHCSRWSRFGIFGCVCAWCHERWGWHARRGCSWACGWLGACRWSAQVGFGRRERGIDWLMWMLCERGLESLLLFIAVYMMRTEHDRIIHKTWKTYYWKFALLSWIDRTHRLLWVLSGVPLYNYALER